jgi:SAM-dependent methyltransferase
MRWAVQSSAAWYRIFEFEVQGPSMPQTEQSSFKPSVLAEIATDPSSQPHACLLCGGSVQKSVSDLFDTRFGMDGIYEVGRCRRCGFEQLLQVPAAEDLGPMYEEHYNFGGEKETLYTDLRQWFLSSFLYRLWIRLDGDVSFHGRKGTGRLLDIGCNEGRGLRIYAQNGYQVEGLEVNKMAAAVARQAGHKVHACDLGDLDPLSCYDVVVLSNVLEHSPDPRQMLEDASRNLRSGGKVWISCPNSKSWLRVLFGKYWINWHVPFHISQFSPETLTVLLQGVRFVDVKVRQISPAHWAVASFIARVFAKKGRPTLAMRRPILLLALLAVARLVFFPILWLGNLLGRGDCLLVTATKG